MLVAVDCHGPWLTNGWAGRVGRQHTRGWHGPSSSSRDRWTVLSSSFTGYLQPHDAVLDHHGGLIIIIPVVVSNRLLTEPTTIIYDSQSQRRTSTTNHRTEREGSQDEDNNTFPMVVNHKTSEISSNPSREKTQHATGYFDQTTTKTEDLKKHREIHPANDDLYDPVCNSLIVEHRHKSIVWSNDNSRTLPNCLDRNFDADTRCAIAGFVRHRELARRKRQQRESYKSQTITTNQTQGFAIWSATPDIITSSSTSNATTPVIHQLVAYLDQYGMFTFYFTFRK
ncbi:hypothetical protein QTP88_004067 [Uroleucon formosanum]